MYPVFYFYSMRKLMFLIALFIVCFISRINAQWVSKDDYEATKDFFIDLRRNNRNLSDTNIVVINVLSWDEVININWENIIDNSSFLRYDLLKAIDYKVENSKKYRWTEDVLGRCNFISEKRLNKVSRKYNLEDFWKFFPKGYNDFSLPVFFENYTMCIFYWGNFCGGLCGHAKVSIYKKEETGWKEIQILFQLWS